VAARGRGTATGSVNHRLEWDYAVLDNAALRAALVAPAVTVRTDRVVGVRPDSRGAVATLAAGSERRAALVVDATGQRRAVHGGARRPPAAEQTAVGVVVDAATATPLVRPGEALFMDWRAEHGERGWPSFLYAVPLGGDRVLLEETSLACRPGFPLADLRRRLHRRLARRGIPVDGATEERVRFTVDTPVPLRRGPVLPFGASAPLIHPATGFSVATALRLAPGVATAVRAGLESGGARGAARAAWRAVWSPAALAVHAMRRTGLEALLTLHPAEVPRFFDVFFTIPEEHRWAYLIGREDVPGTVGAMGALFTASPWPLRRHLMLRGLDFRRHPSRPARRRTAPETAQERRVGE
jgi:lycopene beta-cyclase